MTGEQVDALRKAIFDGLDRAESNWGKVGKLLEARKLEKSLESFSADSNIPGYPDVDLDRPAVDEFVALVVDMRGSTSRIKTIDKSIKLDPFQRLYYETSALLPGVATVCGFENGVVTEYLGDGCLVLFEVDKKDRASSVQKVYGVAKNCINEMRELMNTELKLRYSVPPVSLGAGIAVSRALVTLVGIPGNYQPKAIGACVWDATKLSGGTNTVHISEDIKSAWPTSKGGKIKFTPLDVKNVAGYRVVAA